jgi:hypothetical protein
MTGSGQASLSEPRQNRIAKNATAYLRVSGVRYVDITSIGAVALSIIAVLLICPRVFRVRPRIADKAEARPLLKNQRAVLWAI